MKYEDIIMSLNKKVVDVYIFDFKVIIYVIILTIKFLFVF